MSSEQMGPAKGSAERRHWVERFVQLLYVDHAVEEAFAEFVSADYVQHNPGIPDGRDAAVAALAPMFSDPAFRTDVQRVLVDGDLVAIHLHGRREPDPGGAVADFYRIAHDPTHGDRLVEHWDVIQPLPTTSANDHPMF